MSTDSQYKGCIGMKISQNKFKYQSQTCASGGLLITILIYILITDFGVSF